MNIDNVTFKTNLFYIFCFLLLLQSCGGDSSAVESPKASTNIENISMEFDAQLYEQIEITVTGNIIVSDAENLTFQWRQISGIPLSLNNASLQTVMFTTPDLIKNEEVKLELTVTDANNNSQTKDVVLTLLYVNTPPIIEIENDIIVNELTEVMLAGNILDAESDVTSQWQQKSGPSVDITPLENLGISFKAPGVSTEELLTFELTAIDSDGANTTEVINVTVLPSAVNIPKHVLLLTTERIAEVKRKIAQDATAWNALKSKINNYFTTVPYNAGEYAGSFALAFYVSGEVKYITRAIELLDSAYFSEPDIGWLNYNNRNSFRNSARWAIMGYTWIKSYITEAQQIKIESMLVLWANYWLEYVDFENDFESFRIGDSDEVTSLAENLTLLGYALNDSPLYSDLSQKVLNVGDTILNRFVIDYYMKDIMAGGAWAEGSDYGPNTQRHWIRTFMINKDQRDILYPINYGHDALQALVHQTLANYSGVYKHGDEEVATDYEPLSDDYRRMFALELMGLLEDEKDLAQIDHWFDTLIANEGYKQSSTTTYFERLLYHDPHYQSAYTAFPDSTINISNGIGLVSSRSNWSKSATNLYFINRNIRVDHEHNDALSFDVALAGDWVTKEVTGYGGYASPSIAHNTILIENADNGSSSPTLRAAGKPNYLHISNDENITLISAEATDTYNMSGYFATNYAELVNRQLAFIKSGIVITYDHIITYPDQIRDLIQYNDLGLTQGMSYTRWVKTIQHFQVKPEKKSPLENTFLINDGKSNILFQNIWPINSKINVINEQELWPDLSEYQIPNNQKKWHLSIANDTKTPDNEIINVIQFSSVAEEIEFDQNPIVMTKANGYIKSDSIIGVAISSSTEKFIILFNQTPHKIIENVEYTLPTGYGNALVYGVGVDLK